MTTWRTSSREMRSPKRCRTSSIRARSPDGLVGARAHVDQGEGVAVHDEVDVVDVPGEGLDGHAIDANTAAAQEFLHGEGGLGHAPTVPRWRARRRRRPPGEAFR